MKEQGKLRSRHAGGGNISASDKKVSSRDFLSQRISGLAASPSASGPSKKMFGGGEGAAQDVVECLQEIQSPDKKGVGMAEEEVKTLFSTRCGIEKGDVELAQNQTIGTGNKLPRNKFTLVQNALDNIIKVRKIFKRSIDKKAETLNESDWDPIKVKLTELMESLNAKDKLEWKYIVK